MRSTVRMGVIGLGAAGIRHARACLLAPVWFPDSNIEVRRQVCADVDAAAAARAADQLGFGRWTADWRDVISDPEVDAIAVATPNDSHLEIIEAAAAGGKHVLCEKPVGLNPAQTAAAAAAIEAGGIVFMVGYNYRCIPALVRTRTLIESDGIGRPTHYRGRYFTSSGTDSSTPLSWRYLRSVSGNGTLADLMSHVIDTAQFLFGPITEVVGDKQTFVEQRPAPGPEGVSAGLAPVENEDYVSALARFANGAQGTLEGCRVICGPTNEMAFELNGSAGSVKWSLERMHELEIYTDSSVAQGYTQAFSQSGDGAHGNFNPGAGNGPSLMDLKAIEMNNFLGAVLGRVSASPGISAALAVARVQAAIARSWASGTWERVGSFDCP
ncbi:MAG: Gfo/Idh/MocA family oxidoreductase [Chloroflexota bacterium]|nr:Gfo/Idh/MocA family oxidoreductase [Chloroflexota bacterium]